MKKSGIYKCGDVVIEALSENSEQVSCCDKPMDMLDPKTEDKGSEKHVPVVEKTDGGIKVRIGDTPHPMEDEHYIQWVEVINGKDSYRHFFCPGDEPEAVFNIEPADDMVVREHCNVHGLWKKG